MRRARDIFSMGRSYLFYSIALVLFSLASRGQEVPAVVFQPEDSVRVKIKQLNINSNGSDFSPVLMKDTLMFVSGRPAKLGVTYSGNQNTEVTNLFYAVKRDSVNFSKTKTVPGAINSPYNEGPFTVSADGTTIYFSGNAKPAAGAKTASPLQVYASKKVKGRWTSPGIASFCSAGSSNCHPAFSKDNATIVFCSDMPGGYGGTDLYYTRFKNNEWTKAVNLGPKINSTYNELFPFLSGDSALYFSSNRPGVGGLDLYAIRLSGDTGTGAALLEAPFNTAEDDFGIWLCADGRSGYFSSNRRKSSRDDIYYFHTLHPDYSAAVSPTVKTKFCYTFFEENAYQANDSVSMSYEWDFGDGNKIRSEKCKYCFKKPGDYEVRLNVVEKNSGEVFYNQVTYTLTVSAPPGLFIQAADTAVADKDVMMDALKCSLKGYRLLEFHWSFGDNWYTGGIHARHRYRKKGMYTILLGVMAQNETTGKIEKFKTEKKIVIKD
jgi:hypothetical protein